MRDDVADRLKERMLSIVQALYANIIDRKKLVIYAGEFCWNLQVDVLVFSELNLSQLDHIALAIRAAFVDLQLPQTIATMNANTGKIEMGLVEEVYADRENTDQPVRVIDKVEQVPFVISLGLAVDELSHADLPLIALHDATEEELQCLDQVLHVAASFDGSLKIHGFVQSQCKTAVETCSAGLPAALFLQSNMRKLLQDRLIELNSQ